MGGEGCSGCILWLECNTAKIEALPANMAKDLLFWASPLPSQQGLLS
jgi:hypothetical protein